VTRGTHASLGGQAALGFSDLKKLPRRRTAVGARFPTLVDRAFGCKMAAGSGKTVVMAMHCLGVPQVRRCVFRQSDGCLATV
jgi:hypothetical protein